MITIYMRTRTYERGHVRKYRAPVLGLMRGSTLTASTSFLLGNRRCRWPCVIVFEQDSTPCNGADRGRISNTRPGKGFACI